MDVESILKWTLIGGVTAFGLYIVYQFAVKQGWLSARFRPRLTRMKASSFQRRLAPPRKTEEERRLTHEAIYGVGSPVPERQYRFRA